MKISSSTLRRLPIYYDYLISLPEDCVNISATLVAADLRYGDVQVRKDLAAVSSAGRPRIGYNRVRLIKDMEHFLGYDKVENIIVITGSEPRLEYKKAVADKHLGTKLAAVFSMDDQPEGDVLPVSELASFCKRAKVRMCVLDTDAEDAAEAAAAAVKAGIKSIWNLTGAYLRTGSDITVYEDSLSMAVAMLKSRL